MSEKNFKLAQITLAFKVIPVRKRHFRFDFIQKISNQFQYYEIKSKSLQLSQKTLVLKELPVSKLSTFKL